MKSEYKNFSERLRFSLGILGVSQTELARRIHVKPQVIQYLYAGNSHTTKFMFDIAEALKIDVSWLATGRGNPPSNNDFLKIEKSIPILSFNQIKDWKILGKKIDLAELSRIPIHDDININSFAVTLIDQSMAPRFNINTIVIIDPSIDMHQISQNNRFVLAYLASEDFLVFRQLNVTTKTKTLMPVNSKLYKDTSLTEKDALLGVCKEARWST